MKRRVISGTQQLMRGAEQFAYSKLKKTSSQLFQLLLELYRAVLSFL
jgi:hypothetical protein